MIKEIGNGWRVTGVWECHKHDPEELVGVSISCGKYERGYKYSNYNGYGRDFEFALSKAIAERDKNAEALSNYWK